MLMVRVLGKSPDGEVWSVNPRFGFHNGGVFAQTTPGALALEQWAAKIGALNTGNVLPSGLRGLLSTSLSIEGIRCEVHTLAGQMTQAAEFTLGTPAVGTNTLQRPLNVAACFTLNRGASFGRSGRGRLFFPACAGPALNTSARVPETARNQLSAELVAWLKAVRDAFPDAGGPPSEILRPLVWSRTKGTTQWVQNVAMGDVLDSQRRRRDALRESYSLAAYTD
jgi:hypothetical protein